MYRAIELTGYWAIGVLRHFIASLPLCLIGSLAFAQPSRPLSVPPPGPTASAQIPQLRDVGLDQHLDAQLPLDLPFVDENGRDVTLGQYFGRKPVVLALVYYECPMLCSLVLNGLVASLEVLTPTVGKDFDVVAVSFDPGETPALAAERRKTFLSRYGRAGADAGVHFLTGRETSIKALTGAVGFRYAYDPTIDQFAHPAAITVLTQAGRISRYLFGVEFAPRDLKLSLVEAGDGRIGSVLDQALLFCFHYDPETGKYGLVIMNFIRLGGVMTVAGLGAFVLVAVRRDRRLKAALSGAPAAGIQ
jgi:protein SCO1